MPKTMTEEFKALKKNLTKKTMLIAACFVASVGCTEFGHAEKVDQYNVIHADFMNKYGHNEIMHPDAIIAPDQDLVGATEKFVIHGDNIKFVPLEAVKTIDGLNSVDQQIKDNKIWILSRRNQKDTMGAVYPKKTLIKISSSYR